MRKFLIAFAVLAIEGQVALAGPIFGTDSFVQNPTFGVTCNGDLAVGVTCNNNTSLSGTGQILWDGGQTGDFAAVPSGTIANDIQLTSNVGQSYSFTSAFGNFTGTIASITLGGFGNLTSLTNFLDGTFTPLFGGFDPGPASFVMAYTEAVVAGVKSFSVSDTIASPPASVSEPTTLAILGASLIFLGWRYRTKKLPPSRSATAI